MPVASIPVVPHTVVAGDNFHWPIKLQRPGATVLNLDNWTGVRGQIRSAPDSVDILASFDVSYPDRSAGDIDLALSTIITATVLPIGQPVHYDVEVYRPGETKTFVKGTITALQQVTR